MSAPRRFQVVVVGAGFSGLQAAQSLADSGAKVLVIDRNNYHTFVPLIYQVAFAQIAPEHIAYPIRNIARRRANIDFLMAEVKSIDFDNQKLEADDYEIFYNFLVLATGSRSQFLGVPGAREHAFALRTLEEAIGLRARILGCLEKAATVEDPALRQQLLTFTIIGGGATGVEVAGALVELARCLLSKEYSTLKGQRLEIVLLQAGDRLLPDFPDKLGEYARQRLVRMGVKVRLQTRAIEITPEAVHLPNEQPILCATAIWTAGVEAALPFETTRLSLINRSKPLVLSTLQLPEYPNVYAIGDLVALEGYEDLLVGVAPEALQQGVAAARNIKRQLARKNPRPFRYFNKGRLAIIGDYSGVGKIGPFAFTGFLPWLMWLGVHLVYLPGWHNRLSVLIGWIHNYLLGDRAIRMILSRKAARI